MGDSAYNKVVLTVNPSHSTSEEDTFWQEVAAKLVVHGWRLVEIAARKIPETPNAHTMVMPAKLWEFARKTSNLPADVLDLELPWASPADFDLLADWEHRRWQVDQHKREIRSGLMRLAHLAETAVNDLRPAVVLTTNKIDHPCYLFRKAALYHGSYAGVIERSPFDSIWLEDSGFHAESGIWEASKQADYLHKPELRNRGEQVIQRLRANPEGLRRANLASSFQRESSEPLFLLALDNVLWSAWEQKDHPQRTIDYPMFETPEEAMEAIAKATRSLAARLIVKKHPACVCMTADRMPAGVTLVESDLGTLISAADVVIGFNTKVAFPAMAMRKPTVTLAPNVIAASGATYHCLESEKLIETMHHSLERKDFSRRFDDFVCFCGWLASGYFYGATQDDEIHSKGPREFINDLLAKAEPLMPGDDHSFSMTLSNISRLATGQPGGIYSRASDKRRKGGQERVDTKKCPIGLALEVNRLFEWNLRNSGIARYVGNLVTGLETNDDYAMQPVVTKSLSHYSNETLESYKAKLEELIGDRVIYAQNSKELGQALKFRNRSQSWEIFHSSLSPIPPRDYTGTAARIVTIYDVIYVKYPDLYPPGHVPATRKLLDSIDVDRDYAICISQNTYRDLLELLPLDPDQVCVIPLAAQPEFFEPDVGQGRRVLEKVGVPEDSYSLFLYQDAIRKNASNTVRAFSILEKSGFLRNHRILVIAPSELQQRFDEHAARLGLSPDSYRVLTDIDDSTMSGLFACASAFCYASLYEGFGLPVVEAMAAGCPVVTSGCSSLPEVGGSSVIYVDPTDPLSIADGLALAITTPALRSQLRLEGRQQAKKFSWDRVIEQTVEFYQYVLRRENRI